MMTIRYRNAGDISYTVFDYAEMGLKFIHREITEPVPKGEKIDVPYSDGLLDLTAVRGRTFYENRIITLQFETMSVRGNWPTERTEVKKAIHNKEVTISFDDDAGWLWSGRALMTGFEENGASATITITVEANPYKKGNTQAKGPFTQATTIEIDTVERDFLTFNSTGMYSVAIDDGINYSLTRAMHEVIGEPLFSGHHSIVVTPAAGASVTVYVQEGLL